MVPCLSVLLLSDETAYCYALRREMVERFGVLFNYVRTETEAISYMRGIGVYRDRKLFPLPDIFLLDTLHPDGSDLRLLAWIREQPELSFLPLVILVEDAGESVVQHAFDIGANSFLIRRDQLAGLEEVLASAMEAKWLRHGGFYTERAQWE